MRNTEGKDNKVAAAQELLIPVSTTEALEVFTASSDTGVESERDWDAVAWLSVARAAWEGDEEVADDDNPLSEGPLSRK